MGDMKSKFFTAIFVLFIVVAGYQAITQTGSFIAEEILHISEVEFWIYSFVFLLVVGVLILGISPFKILKEL